MTTSGATPVWRARVEGGLHRAGIVETDDLLLVSVAERKRRRMPPPLDVAAFD